MAEPLELEKRPFKNRLAWTVFLCSFFGCLFFGGYLIHAANDKEKADKVFTTLIPLFGTWAGTILAFYFARENFDSANQSVTRLVNRLTPDQQLAQLSVRQVMKPRSKIDLLSDAAPETGLTVGQLRDVVAKGNTRVPILAGEKIMFVVHEGTLNKYLVSKAGTPAFADIGKQKLVDFLTSKLGDTEIRTIVTKFAVVKLDATLADARDEMLKVQGAQDVFVTATGLPSEKVEGWITNSDMTRDLAQ